MATASSSLRALTNNSAAGNARFNAEAAAWDKNPFVHTASKHALDALLARFPALDKSNPTLDVLEIGCGTGLLTLPMAPYVRRIVAVDAAEGMVRVLEEKVANDTELAGKVLPVCELLEDPEDLALPPASASDSNGPRLKYDLIISHLVLHHIPSLAPVLTTMLHCLKPGGVVALTDFEYTGPESRSFHPRARMEGVERDGIHVGEMEGLMQEVGFEGASVDRAWEMEKRVERWEGEFAEEGEEAQKGMVRLFPFVVCRGTKGRS